MDETHHKRALAFAVVLAFSAAIRLYFNNIVQFMTEADEGTYFDYAQRLWSGGIGQYADLVRTYIGDRDMWLFPSPLRWSWIGTTAIASSIAGECTYRVLATVSMLAGIATVALTWHIARELFDDRIALIAAAFAATSPLQLALGRRALADEFFGALVLATIASLLWYTDKLRACRVRQALQLVPWVVFATLTFGAKEQFLLVYPLLLGFWWLRTRTIDLRTLIAWALPGLLYFAIFCALAHDVRAFFTIAHLTTSTIGAEYPEQYQNGAPHRLLIDLIALAPVVMLLAIAAIGRLRNATKNERHLLALLAGIFVVHGLLSSKNVRYIIEADALVRIVAASFVVSEIRSNRWITALIAINAAIELAIFNVVFLAGAVYDPVTSELLRTLKMLPH